MTNRLRLLARASFTALACAGIAACGSTSSSSSATSSSATSASNASSTGAPGQAAAAAYLAAHTANPTSIGITQPLPSKPPTGISIISLVQPIPVSLENAAAQAAAAKVIGWSFSTIQEGATPSTAAAAFDAAIAKHPSAIEFNGLPAAVFAQQIAQANAKGIAVISLATGQPNAPGVLADVASASQELVFGRLVAAYLVTHEGAKSQTGVFSFSSFPILDEFVAGVNAALKQWCPGCSTATQKEQISAAEDTPRNVVAYLQQHPSVKSTVFTLGSIATGVSAALKTAGISGVQIVGEQPDPANLANIGTGSETMWVGYPIAILGWREIDLLARHFEHQSIAPDLVPNVPVQAITKANVGSVVADNGNYVGVQNYQAQYEKLWHVG